MKTRSSAEKKNVLVAGGAGFIGSHLCDELLRHSRVICIDNFSTGAEENIHHLLANPDFKFLRQDVTSPIDLDAFPELRPFRIPVEGIQEIYNLACPALPQANERLNIETLLANAFGTKHLLDLAVKYKSVFLHVSSSDVYGKPVDAAPFVESYWGYVDPLGKNASYAEGKRFAENLIARYRERYSLNAKIVRVFSTYGPRMKLTDGRLIPDMVNAALTNREVEIDAGGTLVSLMYISDLIEAMAKFMTTAEQGPLNIGNSQGVLLRDVATKIIALCGSSSRVTEKNGKMVSEGIPDISLAKEQLGWFPVVPLDEGLKKTIEELKSSRVLRFEDVAEQGST